MPSLTTRPLLTVYVAWHPSFRNGAAVADLIYRHFRRDLYESVAGGAGLSVLFRSAHQRGLSHPLEIDFAESQTSAVVVLMDDAMAGDREWVRYVANVADAAGRRGLAARVFPVSVTSSGLRKINPSLQAIRYDRWSHLSRTEQNRSLISELTNEFCRMLRHYLERLRRPRMPAADLALYLEKVRVFLSHSKHDDYGERIARGIRRVIHDQTALASFFDIRDIPAGLSFADVLEHYVRVSAVIAVHTDSYSSREWCRREIIEAKRHNVPLVVANCIADFEERGFPYMGNVPVVRMDPADHRKRISHVIGRLLDEVLKDFLWRCRVELVRRSGFATTAYFLPRPPELISIVSIPQTGRRSKRTMVYPDPPIGAEEQALFELVAPSINLRSFTEWLARLR